MTESTSRLHQRVLHKTRKHHKLLGSACLTLGRVWGWDWQKPRFFSYTPSPKWSVPAVPCSVHCTSTTAYAAQCGFLWQYVCALRLHCQQLAVYLQPTFSLHCSYTETTLPVHSTSVWAFTMHHLYMVYTRYEDFSW